MMVISESVYDYRSQKTCSCSACTTMVYLSSHWNVQGHVYKSSMFSLQLHSGLHSMH